MGALQTVLIASLHKFNSNKDSALRFSRFRGNDDSPLIKFSFFWDSIGSLGNLRLERGLSILASKFHRVHPNGQGCRDWVSIITCPAGDVFTPEYKKGKKHARK